MVYLCWVFLILVSCEYSQDFVKDGYLDIIVRILWGEAFFFWFTLRQSQLMTYCWVHIIGLRKINKEPSWAHRDPQNCLRGWVGCGHDIFIANFRTFLFWSNFISVKTSKTVKNHFQDCCKNWFDNWLVKQWKIN
jgi:hypothetical protein